MKGVLAEAGEAGRKAEGGYRSTVTCGVPRCAGVYFRHTRGCYAGSRERLPCASAEPFIAAHSTLGRLLRRPGPGTSCQLRRHGKRRRRLS